MGPVIPLPPSRKKQGSEPAFEHPPLWIHEAVAGRLFLKGARSRRDAKRLAVLQLLDRIPLKK